MTEQEQADNGYPDSWKPGPGESIKGIVTALDARDGGFGPYPILTIRQDDGTELAVHGFHTVLKNEIIERRPAVGDPFEITYLGRKGDGGSYGNGYEAYRVGGKDKEFSWDQFLSPEDRAEQRASSAAPPVEAAPAPAAVAAGVSPDDDDLPF